MIRLATTSDLPTIALIDPFSGDRNDSIKEKRVFIYLRESVICGFASMSHDGLLGRPYIQYLAVQPEHQRQGIAKELLLYIEQLFSKQKLFISTESINTGMKSLLENSGYTFAGRIAQANLNNSDEIYYFKNT